LTGKTFFRIVLFLETIDFVDFQRVVRGEEVAATKVAFFPDGRDAGLVELVGVTMKTARFQKLALAVVADDRNS
jgi:hypothetical protein